MIPPATAFDMQVPSVSPSHCSRDPPQSAPPVSALQQQSGANCCPGYFVVISVSISRAAGTRQRESRTTTAGMLMTSKQAVLLIHGIGEQRPMDTLRGFVETVWVKDTNIHHADAIAGCWSKPDQISDSFELRRLTTSQSTAGTRTDFYEFYWAHLMKGTTFGHLFAWARSLLLRSPHSVPRHLLPVYWILVAGAAVSVALSLYSVYASQAEEPALEPWISWLLTAAILPAIGWVLKNIVGDAARYLHVSPDNIQCRHEIRQAGVDLLTRLHARNYERIIVVGHSLGSVIGYDILYHYWSKVHATHSPTAQSTAALCEVERQVVDPHPDDNLDKFQAAQRALARELKTNECPWIITDFVTLGSPLAHAAILLARDEEELKEKQALRELQTCPPSIEISGTPGKQSKHISYQPGPGGLRIPHHAAAFAATRWTNLYFPRWMLLGGDMVGGPLAPWFKNGVRDVKVETSLRGGFLSHTLYWVMPNRGKASHIDALRKAINLLDI